MNLDLGVSLDNFGGDIEYLYLLVMIVVINGQIKLMSQKNVQNVVQKTIHKIQMYLILGLVQHFGLCRLWVGEIMVN